MAIEESVTSTGVHGSLLSLLLPLGLVAEVLLAPWIRFVGEPVFSSEPGQKLLVELSRCGWLAIPLASVLFSFPFSRVAFGGLLFKLRKAEAWRTTRLQDATPARVRYL